MRISHWAQSGLRNRVQVINPVLVCRSRLGVGLSDFAVFTVFDVISREWLKHFFQKFDDVFRSMVSIGPINMGDFSKGIVAVSRSLHPSNEPSRSDPWNELEGLTPQECMTSRGG
jgi:hypothetical protein